MGLFDRFKKKAEKEIDEISCDKCGKTLKAYKNSKDKHLCDECYLKILNK
jgi:protein-arginine kinase activator protein McsA